jgi:hypothetical protein
MKNKILNFLTKHPCKSTAYIAKHCIFEEEYKKDEARYNNRVIIGVGSHNVSRAYYQLRKLQNEGLVEQVGRGIWKIKLPEQIDIDPEIENVLVKKYWDLI